MRSASAKQNGLTEERIDEGINNWRDSDAFSAAEKIALEYSEMMQFTPEQIDEGFYRRLADHYSAPEVVELGVFIGFNVGYHTFFRTLDFYPMFTPDGRLVSQDESRRIYGNTPQSHLSPQIRKAVADALADDQNNDD